MADIIHGLGAPFQYPLCITDTEEDKAKRVIPPTLEKLGTVKNLAQSLGGLFLCIQGIPRLIQLIPANVEGILSRLEWLSYLKPFEKALSAIKSVGNVLEFPERLIALRKASGEWDEKSEKTNRWKAVYRYTSAFYIGLEAIVLAPLKWGVYNLLAIGGWAAKIGLTASMLGYVRDGFTALSSGINVVAEGKNRDKALSVIAKHEKRIVKDGTLDSLKDLVNSKQPITHDLLKKIDELKKKQWDGKDKSAVKKKAQTEIDKLTKSKDKLIEDRNELKLKPTSKEFAAAEQEIQSLDQKIQLKQEKLARMALWEADTKDTDLDKLRSVVAYRNAKSEVIIANNQMAVEKSTVTRWYDITKCAVVIFTNMIALGVAAVLAPAIGLSAAAVGTFLFLGQWVTGLGCSLAGLGKCAAMLRYEKNFALPQTQLPRA